MDNDNEEYRWYGCPRCKIIWRYHPDHDGSLQIFDPPKDAAKLLAAVEGEKYEVEKSFPEKPCPRCEITVDGKKKGPVMEIDLEKEGFENVKDLKCSVCGSDDFEYEDSDIFPGEDGTLICKNCTSLIYIEFSGGGELISAYYREDLEYVEYIKQLEEGLDCFSRIMKKKGTPIAKEDAEKVMKRE